MRICSIDGCGKPARTRGWCNTHHMRWYRHGDPLRVSDQRGEGNNNWRGTNVSYFGAHNRVKRLRGCASEHQCVRCAQPAREWAYGHADPDELTNELGHAYSADPMQYLPMCNPCHQAFDRQKEIA